MTRKDYKLIAEAISAADLSDATQAKVVWQLSKRLVIDNPRFDRELFAKACEPKRVLNKR